MLSQSSRTRRRRHALTMTHVFRNKPVNLSLPRREQISAQAMRQGDGRHPLDAVLDKYNNFGLLAVNDVRRMPAASRMTARPAVARREVPRVSSAKGVAEWLEPTSPTVQPYCFQCQNESVNAFESFRKTAGRLAATTVMNPATIQRVPGTDVLAAFGGACGINRHSAGLGMIGMMM